MWNKIQFRGFLYFVVSGFYSIAKNYCTIIWKRTVFPLGKRRPRTTQSMGSFRRLRQQDMKRVASAPVVVNSYRNQVKAGIVKAMLPRSDSSHMRSAFGAAEMWRSKLLTSRPSLEKGLSSKNSWPHTELKWQLDDRKNCCCGRHYRSCQTVRVHKT